MESFSGLLLLKLFIINYSRVNLHTKPSLFEKQNIAQKAIKQTIALSPQGIKPALFFGLE